MSCRGDAAIPPQVADASTDRLPNAADTVGELLLGDGQESVTRLEVGQAHDLPGQTLEQICS